MFDPFEEIVLEIRTKVATEICTRKSIKTVLMLSPLAAQKMLDEILLKGAFKRGSFYLNGHSGPLKIEHYIQTIKSFKDESLKEFKLILPSNGKLYYTFLYYDAPVINVPTIINTSMTGTKAIIATAPD